MKTGVNIFTKGGSEYVTSLIEEAVSNGSREARVSGNFEIAEAVRLPSDFTLVLEDCHLRMADGVYSNMFINAALGSEECKRAGGGNKNIRIVGKGRAILDGGKYNGLSEKNHSRDGMPPIWKNNLLLFANVDGFSISNISCYNQRWWALNFLYCSNGYLGNIDFRSNDTAIDEEGKEYHGLIRERYSEVLVKNSDGIDLRQGCHDILIENITGFTEDDTVALTALDGRVERAFGVEDLPSDICNVVIRNIHSSAFCTNVRLLNQGDIKLHDILIDGVEDTSPECPYMNHGIYAVRVGDTKIYGTRHATKDETYNITVKNVRGAGKYVICLAGEMDGLVMENIEAIGDTQILLDERSGIAQSE